jgi:uncharacterized protein involved in type VI secretion and phage assembly
MSGPVDRRREDWAVHRFFGKYEGVVTDVSDPTRIGRLRARVPAVLGEDVETGWALPCTPYGGGKDHGMLFLPHVGDTVWIEFAGGDVSRPLWTGTFWGAPDSAGGPDDLAEETGAEAPTGDGGKDASDTLAVLKTRGGHELTFDDDGEVVLLSSGTGKSSLRFEQDGTVVITAEKVKLGAGASEKLVLGDAFMQLFNAHTHPTGVGPSGPPAQSMASSHLSQKVTTE